MCGVVGIIGPNSVSQKIFDALTMLQHRGQDAAGILTCDGYQMCLRKGKGLAVEVIRARHMQRLHGNIGIGHVRYPTAGSDSDAEAQPFYVNAPYGVSLIHNGNLTNSKQLFKQLIADDRRHLNTRSDSETLLNVLASELEKQNVPIREFSDEIFFNAVKKVNARAKGGYAVVGVIAGAGLFAFRDPNGVRPLCWGYCDTELGREYMIASESLALDCEGYTVIGDVAPGEAIFIDLKGNVSRKICAEETSLTPCIFEYVYLARPDSVIDGVNVYSARLEMGRKVAKRILKEHSEHDIDVVIPVPDSGRHAALPIAKVLNVPYREGFVKNRYVGRTFIMPGQAERQKSIRKKLNTIPHEFAGKHVLLVDDSIVRGNTSKLIIEMARAAGARKVSIVSAAPPVRYPNVYGIDMPTSEELVAFGRTEEEVAKEIGADNVYYQTLEDLIASIQSENQNISNFETSVFDGKYVTGDIDARYFKSLAKMRNEQTRLSKMGSLDMSDED
ncbi:amidophosphoribosyltransferase [Francisellaceae bacterium]|nr:amidophosphoribosyltransferase [Francisellaceae bacterium]